jgi:protein-disulfide isomerase
MMSDTPGSHILTLPVTIRDHIRGPVDAPWTLVEYGDYECAACKAAYPVTESLFAALRDRLRFVFRNFPCSNIHPHAQRAAEAAQAASDQGRFWEMHEILLQHQDALGTDELVEHAARLHLDVARFVNDLLYRLHTRRIRDDFHDSVKSGVNGTPTFFVNGFRYDGPCDAQSLASSLLESHPHTRHGQLVEFACE